MSVRRCRLYIRHSTLPVHLKAKYLHICRIAIMVYYAYAKTVSLLDHPNDIRAHTDPSPRVKLTGPIDSLSLHHLSKSSISGTTSYAARSLKEYFGGSPKISTYTTTPSWTWGGVPVRVMRPRIS